MKFSFKSSLKALLAGAMMLQVGVISAKAADLPQIEAANITNVESDKTGAGHSALKLIDGDKTTNGRWETGYSQDVTNRMPVTITFTLDGVYNVGKVILYTDTNKGAPTDFTVSTSKDNSTWTTGTNKTVSQDDMAETGASPLEVTFTPEEAKYVKIVVNHSTASANDYNPADGFLKLSEIELYGTATADVDKTSLQALYDKAAAITEQGFYTDDSWNTFTSARAAADTVLKNDAATREEVDNAKNTLQSALNGLVETPINKIAHTNVTSVEANQADDGNDPNTLCDGNTTNRWQTPYHPFETVRMPVVFNLTLNSVYKVGKVSLYTNNTNTGAPLNFQVETSTDNATWNTAHSVTFEQADIPATGYTPLSVRFDPENAKYVRITILHTSATASNPVDTFAQLTEIEVFGELDKTALVNAITDAEAEAAKTTVYTAVSIAALQSVINTANALKDNGSATLEQVTAQISALENAITALVRLADKTALKAKIDAAKAIDTTNKTPNSVTALQNAISAAEAVYNDAQAVQADADNQVTKLTAAIDGLVDKANTTALDAAIAAAEAEVAKTDTYTEASINAVQDLIDAAKDLKADENATQDAVDAEVTKLNHAVAAMDKIGEAVDKTPLISLIATAKTEVAKTDVYTAESIAALQKAIDDAEAILDSVDSSVAVQEQVDLLQAAIDALEEKGNTPTPTPVDKGELVKSIAAAKAEVNKTDVYTAESLEALQDAIDAAEAVNNDENATEADVNAAIKAIDDAVKGLVKVEEPNPDKEFSATDEATNIHVSADAGVVDPNAELVVTPVNASNVNDKIAEALKSLGGKQLAYNITLLLNNVEIQPNGELRITLFIPKGFLESGKHPKLYHISDDGKITPVKIKQGAMLEDGSGWTIFYTDHLSVFVVVDEVAEEVIKPNQPIDKNPLAPSKPIKDTATDAKTPNTGDNTMAMTYVMLLVCAGAFLVFAYKRKDNEA